MGIARLRRRSAFQKPGRQGKEKEVICRPEQATLAPFDEEFPPIPDTVQN
jgi:hypothetical protein